MSRRYDTVIFDLDGTLLNTLEDLADGVNAALKHFGRPERTLDEVRQFVGNGVLNLMDRAVPEVWGSKYDVRELLRAAYYAIDKKTIDEVPLSFKEKMLLKADLKAVKGTDVEILLKESGLIK